MRRQSLDFKQNGVLLLFPPDWADGEAGSLDGRCPLLSPPVNGSGERVCRRHMQGGGDHGGMDLTHRHTLARARVCVQVFVSMGVPKSVDASVGLWINHHICVSVLVAEGAGGGRPLCTPAAATRPATCSRIREHADYTRHNGNTQTQICPQPTKEYTHTRTRTRTASPLIAWSNFSLFPVW